MKKLLLLSFAFAFLVVSCKKKPTGGVLENTYWQLSSMKLGVNEVDMGDKKTTLVFSADGLEGMGPCNSYFGNYSTSGSSISVAEFGSTEMACEELNTENQYFGLLTKATGYSANEKELTLFAEGGELAFLPMDDQQRTQAEFDNGVGKLVAKFPEFKSGDAVPHLYPIVRVDNPGNYPYTGTLVDTASYKFFDSQSSEIWNTTGGDVMVVGKYGDLYICRVPGRYVSSDIAIFRLKNNKLQRSETVAWAWCDEGWCNQQDTWLKDVNEDGRIDLIQRYTLTDDKGKMREGRMTVLVQAEDGSFAEDKSQKLDPAQYKMAKI